MLKKAHGHGGFGGAGGRFLFQSGRLDSRDKPADSPATIRQVAGGRFRFHAQVKRPQQPAPIQARDFRPAAEAEPQAQSNGFTLASINLGDPRVDKAVRQAERLLEKDIPILVHGETGVGKEVFVKALHQSSSRAKQALIAVNCAAIPAELVESELFGYEKGAFTGASQKGSIGLIRKAHKGTLFLDEVGDMPLRVQARLLRVLQERCVQPLGSSELYPVDIRLVSATNRPLRQDVEAGLFRQDLYYRISGLNLELPPLRQRTDKAAMVQRIWDHHREPQQWAGLSPEVMALFERHPWPGNLRQLSSVLQIALAMADDQQIRAEHLPDDFFADLQGKDEEQTASGQPALAALADNDLARQLQACGGNISHLAKRLGLSRNTLYKRLREQGLRL